MSRIGVMICGHGSRDDAACVEFRRVVDQDRRSACRNGRWRWAISSSRGRSSARASTACARSGVDHVLAVPGHAVRGRAREERRALGAQRLRRRARAAARDGPRPRHRRQAAGGRARPDRRGAGAGRERCRRSTRPASSWSAAAPRTATPTATSPRSPACCGRAWASRMPRSAIRAWPTRAPRWRSSAPRGWASGASSSSPTSCSPACWCVGSTRRPTLVAARHPEIEFVKAHYLDDHPLVIETFVERIRGIGAGDVNMNCSLCKYRTQVLGLRARPRARRRRATTTMSRASAPTAATITTIITASRTATSTITTIHHHGRGQRQRRGLRPTRSGDGRLSARPGGDLRAVLRADPRRGAARPLSAGLARPRARGWSMPAACRTSPPTSPGAAIRSRRAERRSAPGRTDPVDAAMVAAGVMPVGCRPAMPSCSLLDDERAGGTGSATSARPARRPRSSSGARISPAPSSRSAMRRPRCSICSSGCASGPSGRRRSWPSRWASSVRRRARRR